MKISSGPEGRWDITALVAIVVMTGVLIFHLLTPKPNTAKMANKHDLEAQTIARDTERFREKVVEDRAYIESKLWTTDANQIGAEIMAVVDDVAKKKNINVQAFRPQRTVEMNNLVRYPYSVIVQGSFPRILELVRDLQDPGTKLAVTSVQMTAADGATDTVTATVSVAAFLESMEVMAHATK